MTLGSEPATPDSRALKNLLLDVRSVCETLPGKLDAGNIEGAQSEIEWLTSRVEALGWLRESPVGSSQPKTFGVLAVESGNFLEWHSSRDKAVASAERLRELNPEMPADGVAVVEFDSDGLSVGLVSDGA